MGRGFVSTLGGSCSALPDMARQLVRGACPHRLSFWHWGDNPGYKGFTLAQRDSRTGVVVMTNADGGQAVCS